MLFTQKAKENYKWIPELGPGWYLVARRKAIFGASQMLRSWTERQGS